MRTSSSDASSLCTDFARSNEQAASLGRDLKVGPDTLQLGRIPGIRTSRSRSFFLSPSARKSAAMLGQVSSGVRLNVRR